MQPLNERLHSPLLLEREFDLRQYGNLLARRKWLIIAFAIIATATAAAIAFMQIPLYRATATVLIESQVANVIQIQNIYDVDTRGQEYYQTQFEILKSRPLAEAVVHELSLAKNPEFQPATPLFVELTKPLFVELTKRWSPPVAPAPVEVNSHTLAVDRYMHNLRVQPKAKTQLVSVSYDSSDAALAATVANAHAQAFIENHMEAKEAMTRTAADWMVVRLQDLRQKLTVAEKNLQAFKEREQLIDLDSMKTLPVQELTELTTKLVEARRSLSEGRNAYAQVSAARFADIEEQLSIPAVAADPLVQNFKQALAEAQARVAELSKRYGPKHPRMAAVISERDAAREQLSQQIDSVVGATKNQYDVLRSQEQALASAMSDTKTHINLAGRKEAEYRDLLREVETNRELYDLFYKRIGETRETDNLATANARVIEPAVTPSAPYRPQKPLIIGMGFTVGLMLGVLCAFFLEAINNTVRHGGDVAEKIRLPLLAMIPRIRLRRKALSIGRQFAERNEPLFAESIRTLRTGINLNGKVNGLDKSIKTIMITSSTSAEGKTCVASNLALAFAQIERVLLVDTDMRRPALAKEFQIAAEHPGLSALCAGEANAAECIVRKAAENLDILPAGIVSSNPQELLASPNFRTLIARLSERYDRIIFDCPPVLPVSDALLLANYVDAAVYVVRAETTPLAQIHYGLDQLRRTRVDVLGVALNKVDVRKIMSYGDYAGPYVASEYLVAETN